ncbi:MAG: hypothetical protein N2C14_02195 [Planctomycetales bacterium]
MTDALADACQKLLARFGTPLPPQGDAPFEVLASVLIARNASRASVTRALENLREADALTPAGIRELSVEELELKLRPVGRARDKAGRLRNVARLLGDRFEDSLEALFDLGTDDALQALTSVNGIGLETAETVLLCVGGLAAPVIDASLYRVLSRHGWIEFETDHESLRDCVESGLGRDPELFRQFHSLIGQVAKEYCRKTPRCEKCPLQPLLPDAGPCEPFFF